MPWLHRVIEAARTRLDHPRDVAEVTYEIVPGCDWTRPRQRDGSPPRGIVAL
jgi:hypothetical protein